MRITVIDNKTKNLKELVSVFDKDELHIFDYKDEYDVSDSDLIILTGGSHYSIFHKPNPFKKESDLIRTCNKPIIGICLGAELVAKTFGSSFGELSNKIRKIIKIRYVDSNKEYNVYECHRYYINKLGKELLGVAESQYGWEIIRHKKKNIFGLQFHPEKTKEQNDGLFILKNIIEEIKSNKV